LLEVLIATTILTAAVVSLAQLFAIATRANSSAREATYASVLARQKMEQLRGLAWGFDPQGLPFSDLSTDITVTPERPNGGVGLSPSPSNTLTISTDGYCDYVDAFGNSLGGGSSAPASTVYIRRWSIEPLPANPADSLVLQVLVTRAGNRGAAARRLPNEARIVSVRTRKDQ
jgi:hypothetical protein